MSEQNQLLKEILRKLENIELLLKIGNREDLNKYQIEAKKDHISKKILDLADGFLNYSDLTQKVAGEEDVAEVTVRKKIAKLRHNGFLITKRKGNKVFYENSEIFD